MSKSVLCVVLLLLCVHGCVGSSIGSIQKQSFSSESIHPPPPPSHNGPPPSHSGSGSGSGNPIGNWFRCAKGFHLVVFSVQENYTSPSTSEIFSLTQPQQLIGLAAGNCPDIPGTESPPGSGVALQQCVFTYELFNRGRFVETGTFDPSPNGVSNNAVTGIDGEFFQALGLEHIQNFPDGNAAIDTFYLCEVNTNICNKDKDNEHDNDHDDGKEHNKP